MNKIAKADWDMLKQRKGEGPPIKILSEPDSIVEILSEELFTPRKTMNENQSFEKSERSYHPPKSAPAIIRKPSDELQFAEVSPKKVEAGEIELRDLIKSDIDELKSLTF